jgi:hypothetical protein
MRKLLILMAVVAAMAAMAVSASGASAAIRYEVCHGPAPIRSGPESGASKIGELSNGEIFEAITNSYNNFDYGYAYGYVHADGYMNRNYECAI